MQKKIKKVKAKGASYYRIINDNKNGNTRILIKAEKGKITPVEAKTCGHITYNEAIKEINDVSKQRRLAAYKILGSK